MIYDTETASRFPSAEATMNFGQFGCSGLIRPEDAAAICPSGQRCKAPARPGSRGAKKASALSSKRRTKTV